MNNINLKYNNNYEVARQLFDNIAHWQSLKNPVQNLESLLGEIGGVLDKVWKNGYDKAADRYCCGGSGD